MMFSWTVKDGTAAYTMIVVPKEVFVLSEKDW